MRLVTEAQSGRGLTHITRNDAAHHGPRRDVATAVWLEAKTRSMLALVLAQMLLEGNLSRGVGVTVHAFDDFALPLNLLREETMSTNHAFDFSGNG